MKTRLAAWLLATASVLGASAGDDPAVHVERLLAQGDVDAALASARAALEAGDATPRVRALYGRALFRSGRFDEARETLLPIPDEGDEDATALAAVLLARIEAASGHAQAAADWVERARPESVEDPYVVFWAAELVGRERSSALLERYLELAPAEQEDWIEAARGRLRLNAALRDRDVWVRRSLPERVELPLTLVWDDEGRSLGWVVEVRLGSKDKPVRLMLDSGSTGLFLVERVARKHGFTFLSEETAFGGGGDRRHRNRRGTFETVRLGDLEFGAALAGTTRREIDPYGRYHGLLGLQAFQGYRVRIDLDVGRLVLTLPDVGSGAGLEDGEPYWMISGQMLVRASAGDGPPAMFLFDTGATWSILDHDYAAGLAGATRRPTRDVRGFGGKVRDAWEVRGARVRFAGLDGGDAALRSFDMSVRSAVGDVEVSGFLGLDLLAGSAITVDTVTHRLHVERPRKR